MLEGIHDYAVFIVAALTLALIPGPDTLYALGRTLAGGRRSGVLSVAGIGAGCLVHVCASAFGLSAVLARSPLAFDIIKWIGAAYLAWLGLELLRHAAAGGATVDARAGTASGWAIFRQGFVTNLFNPKVGLFFVSFLPQFVSADARGSLPFLVLGLTFVGIGLAWILVVVMGAGLMAERLGRSRAAARWLKRATGTLFVGLALRLAMDNR